MPILDKSTPVKESNFKIHDYSSTIPLHQSSALSGYDELRPSKPNEVPATLNLLSPYSQSSKASVLAPMQVKPHNLYSDATQLNSSFEVPSIGRMPYRESSQ